MTVGGFSPYVTSRGPGQLAMTKGLMSLVVRRRGRRRPTVYGFARPFADTRTPGRTPSFVVWVRLS